MTNWFASSSSAPLVMFLSRFGSFAPSTGRCFATRACRRVSFAGGVPRPSIEMRANRRKKRITPGNMPPLSAFAGVLSWMATILRIADNHDLGVRARRKLFRRLNALPFKKLRADACCHDFLKVRNALRFDALALGLLLFLLQDEAHSKRLLLRLLLRFDRTFEHRRQLHVAQQHVFHDHAAWRELLRQLILNLLLHQLADRKS